jgi:hypothetical protein
VIAFAEHDPAHVRPEETLSRRMRVAMLIGLLMMDAMNGNPEYGAALKRERTAKREEIFQPERTLISPMGMEPVIAHADSKASGDPVKKDRGQKSGPVEHE